MVVVAAMYDTHKFVAVSPAGAERDAGVTVRGAGLHAVGNLLAVARQLERLAMQDHAQRLRRLADLVAAEYCHLALDDRPFQPRLAVAPALAPAPLAVALAPSLAPVRALTLLVAEQDP